MADAKTEKESLLLIQNSDLSKYSLLSVMGMDAAEIVESLSAMNDDDRLSIATYLESRGAWTTEAANEGTREFREYHLDVRYNTDTNEIVDLRAKMKLDERARATSEAVAAVLETTHSDGLEAGSVARENEGESGATQTEQAESGAGRESELEQTTGTLEFEDMDEGDEFIDFGDEKDQVLAEMKKLLGNDQDTSNQETELAFRIADRFISIQETDSGYDYSIMGADYKEIDGGVYDNPDISIREALNVIVEDLRENPLGNGVRGNIRDNDELIPIDYEGLMEKVEAANRIEPEKRGIIDQITIFDRENVEHKGLRAALFPEQAEPEVTLTVAECGELPNLGEYHENIPTVDEAIAIWRQIPPDRMHGIPAININIHIPGTEPIEDVTMMILFGETIDLESLDDYPEINGNAQAMELITELVAKLPDMEITGIMSMEMEAAVWKKRMPDLAPAEQLAVEIDRFLYNYDRIDYYNNAGDMTESVSNLAESIRQNDTSYITEWLAEVITEEAEPEETRKAKELLEKLAEYKPLAKIEEMEEQSYNMVDNVLNNGAGEKVQKEENKKEQESPAARISLKARLAEKKEIVSGKGKDCEAQENMKNGQREM